MPEFRLRRKKQGPRRRTITDADETARQLEAATKLNRPDRSRQPEAIPRREGEGPGRWRTGDDEQERSMRLTRDEYPDQASGIHVANGGPPNMSNGHGRMVESREQVTGAQGGGRGDDDVIKTSSTSQLPSIKPTLERRISSQFSDCIFLKYGDHLRRCPMPSPITLSTIKNLFVNMFDLSPALLDDPQCVVLIRDKDTQRWTRLDNISTVYDRCTLLLVDSPQGEHSGSSSSSSSSLPAHHSPSQDDLALGQGLSPDINLPIDLDVASRSTTEASEREGEGSEPSLVSHSLPTIHPLPEAQGKREVVRKMIKGHNGLWRTDMGARLGNLTALPDNLRLHPHLSTQHKPNSTPHLVSGTMFSPTSSTSGGSEAPATVTSVPLPPPAIPPSVTAKVRALKADVDGLREEVTAARKEQLGGMARFSREMKSTASRIMAAIGSWRMTGGLTFDPNQDFRRKRLELHPQELLYTRQSEQAMSELSVLESTVEGLRTDVVERRCKVDSREVEGLMVAVDGALSDLNNLREQYDPLRERLKAVMERELQIIVEEERFIQEEVPRLEEARERYHKLSNTLDTLRKFATLQAQRSPHVPFFSPAHNPDRQALMINIEAVTPNHFHRLEALSLAASVRRKRKEVTMAKHSPLKRFESSLRAQHNHLRSTKYASDIDRRREMKLKADFLAEKFERQKKLAEEIGLQQRVAGKKREQEREELEKRWASEQREKREQEREELEKRWVSEQREKMEDQRWRQRESQEIVVQHVLSERRIRNSLDLDGQQVLPFNAHTRNDGFANSNPPRVQNVRRLSKDAPPSFHARTHSDDSTSHPHHTHIRTRSDDMSWNKLNESGRPETLVPLRTGRASLAPVQYRRGSNGPHLIPRERKSIGYSGEFANFDPLVDPGPLPSLPVQGKRMQQQDKQQQGDKQQDKQQQGGRQQDKQQQQQSQQMQTRQPHVSHKPAESRTTDEGTGEVRAAKSTRHGFSSAPWQQQKKDSVSSSDGSSREGVQLRRGSRTSVEKQIRNSVHEATFEHRNSAMTNGLPAPSPPGFSSQPEEVQYDTLMPRAREGKMFRSTSDESVVSVRDAAKREPVSIATKTSYPLSSEMPRKAHQPPRASAKLPSTKPPSSSHKPAPVAEERDGREVVGPKTHQPPVVYHGYTRFSSQPKPPAQPKFNPPQAVGKRGDGKRRQDGHLSSVKPVAPVESRTVPPEGTSHNPRAKHWTIQNLVQKTRHAPPPSSQPHPPPQHEPPLTSYPRRAASYHYHHPRPGSGGRTQNYPPAGGKTQNSQYPPAPFGSARGPHPPSRQRLRPPQGHRGAPSGGYLVSGEPVGSLV